MKYIIKRNGQEEERETKSIVKLLEDLEREELDLAKENDDNPEKWRLHRAKAEAYHESYTIVRMMLDEMQTDIANIIRKSVETIPWGLDS